ncbi:hypothetical protein AGMMS50256_00020 [Betaproteobacteria bacterium]|nr:hypothetical protein AGMMS50256_00020 [Betaproteobacteria bacterium]
MDICKAEHINSASMLGAICMRCGYANPRPGIGSKQWVSFNLCDLRGRSIVQRCTGITPRMRRLALGGPDVVAWLKSDGVEFPAAWVKLRLDGRDGRGYTIRQVDKREGTIDIDFVLHYDGPDNGTVSDWARFARPGDQVDIRGPRAGGFRLLPDSKWIWLAADACALPAAQAIMESLPAGVEVHALFVVHDNDERQSARFRVG